jgi:hypothetical protein
MTLYIVQDATEDRLVRQDGSHVILPPGTILPLCKANKIKLKKDSDGPLEFVAEDLPHEHLAILYGAAGWPIPEPPAPPEEAAPADPAPKPSPAPAAASAS